MVITMKTLPVLLAVILLVAETQQQPRNRQDVSFISFFPLATNLVA